MTLQIGLGIGRLVFCALNRVEVVFVVVVAAVILANPPPAGVIVGYLIRSPCWPPSWSRCDPF